MPNNSSDVPTAAELAEQFGPYTRDGDAFRIACPNHGGERHNLKIWDEDGRIGAKCWSEECDYWDIMAALGISKTPKDKSESKKKKPKKKNTPPKKSEPVEVKQKNLIAVYQHPDGNPRPVYRTDHDGMCHRKNCEEDGPHKHVWGPGSPKGCYLLPWGEDDPDNILVLVEGEKAAKALQTALKKTETSGYTAVSWRGGWTAAKDADYGLCKGRVVLCWPDDDDPGREAMKHASNKALLAGATRIMGIATGGDTKRDAADYKVATVIKILGRARPVKMPDAPGMEIEDSPMGLESAFENLNVMIWYNEREVCFHTLVHDEPIKELTYEHVQEMDKMSENSRSALKVEVSKKCVFERRSGNQSYRVPAYFSEEKFMTTLRYLGDRNSFDPVKVWFESLPEWDKKPRIERFLDVLFNAESPEIAAWAGRAIFIGGITRTYLPGSVYDRYPVLVGPQELTKSATISALVPDHNWYTDSLDAGADEKVTIERAGSTLLVEFSELSGIRKWELESLKKFLSKKHDRARLAYGKETTIMPRRWIGIGTANPQSYGILPIDETGNRRFTVVSMESRAHDFRDILSAIQKTRDQLWAEGLYRFRQAVQNDENPVLLYRLPDDLKDESENVVRQHAIRDENAYEIALKAHETFLPETQCSMQQILVNAGVFAETDAAEKMSQHKGLAASVGQELRILGWERDKTPRKLRDKKIRWWTRPSNQTP